MQDILNSHLASSRFFGGNTFYDQYKMLAVQQKLDNIEFQDYNSVSNAWENATLDAFIYDMNGHNTSDTYSDWSKFHNMYEPSYKDVYNYDASGNMTEQLSNSWDSISNQWIVFVKSDYTYNNQGKPTVQFSYYWDESTLAWLASGKEEYTYSGNNLTMGINYYWDPSSSQWIKSYKTENVYNAGGYLTTSTDYTWNFFSSAWVYQSKTENTYNSSYQITMDVTYSWDVITNSWVNDSKDAFSYDANMNMTSDLYSMWDGSVWAIDSRNDYTYNNAYTFNELLLPWTFTQFGLEGFFGHMFTMSTEYDGSSFILTSRTNYNYSSTSVTGITETPVAEVDVYPQPASSSVTFNWPADYQTLDLKLFRVNGELISFQQVEKNGDISIQNLSSGMYFYRLTNHNNTLYAGKLIID